MRSYLEQLVKTVIAHRIDVDPDRIHVAHHLEHDLGLDKLDLVIVALDLEDIERLEFPIARLERAGTVADFVSLVREWLVESTDDEEAPDTVRAAS